MHMALGRELPAKMIYLRLVCFARSLKCQAFYTAFLLRTGCVAGWHFGADIETIVASWIWMDELEFYVPSTVTSWIV